MSGLGWVNAEGPLSDAFYQTYLEDYDATFADYDATSADYPDYGVRDDAPATGASPVIGARYPVRASRS